MRKEEQVPLFCYSIGEYAMTSMFNIWWRYTAALHYSGCKLGALSCCWPIDRWQKASLSVMKCWGLVECIRPRMRSRSFQCFCDKFANFHLAGCIYLLLMMNEFGSVKWWEPQLGFFSGCLQQPYIVRESFYVYQVNQVLPILECVIKNALLPSTYCKMQISFMGQY